MKPLFLQQPPKVALIYKKSRFELFQSEKPELKALVIQKDIAVEHLQRSHLIHLENLARVKQVLIDLKAEVVECQKEDLMTPGFQQHVVMVVGGDGTLLDTCHYVREQVVIGVNSDPDHSLGCLCTATADNLASVLQHKGSIRLLNRMKITLNGEPLTQKPINDILITNAYPAAASHYIIEAEGQSEEQRSSGYWVSTALGSTSAIASAGGSIMPILDKRLQGVIREPAISPTAIPNRLHFFLQPGEQARFTSKMHEGRIYVDGHLLEIPFGMGDKLDVESFDDPICLMLTQKAEEKRQSTGQIRTQLFERIPYV